MRKHLRGTIVLGLFALLLVVVLGAPAQAAFDPAPLKFDPPDVDQNYFVPLPEGDVLDFMDAIDEGGGRNPESPMTSSVGFTIGTPGTVLYFDHHENGYATSEPELDAIWGDNDKSNGFPPFLNGHPNAAEIDTLNVSDVVSLTNEVDVPPNSGELYFDGGDRLASTFRIAVTRSMWADGTDTLLAGAVEVTAQQLWGKTFLMPVGEDSIDFTNDDMFEKVWVFVQVGDTAATIQHNGADAKTLQPGQTAVYKGIHMNDLISASSPVQVHLLTGDVNSAYETRWFSIPPTKDWDTDYYSPVGTVSKSSGDSGCTSVWLFNPNPTTITISYQIGEGALRTDGTVNVAPGTARHWDDGGSIIKIPDNEAAHYFTNNGSLFYALTTTDCDGELSGPKGELYDWGAPLIPTRFLTSVVLIGQAPGCTDPGESGCNNPSDDRSPVWITPVENTAGIYWNYSGQSYACGDPNIPDSNKEEPVNRLQSVKITNASTHDMTGARVFTCDNIVIAAAWGQNPARSGSSDGQALDMGTVIVPYVSTITIDKSVDQTVVKPGTEVTYTYLVENAGTVDLEDIGVYDDTCSNVTPILKGNGKNFGDDNDDDLLQAEFAETWQFQCQQRIEDQTTNKAYSFGTPEDKLIPVESDPDQETVYIISPVGNLVWLDEDSDGIQDAGEPGLPNVKVTLDGLAESGEFVQRELYTDANGGYLFVDLMAPGSYTVNVDLSTLPKDQDGNDAMTQTNNPVFPKADFGNQELPYALLILSADENLTADFGFNWNSDQEVNNPQQDDLGAIGDRVWVDVDGDGIQDAREPGIAGVTIRLENAADGSFVDSDVTDATGNYILDGIAPGQYTVEVIGPPSATQTGDPDHFAENSAAAPAGTAGDNMTTRPIVLGPGDVFLNVDFGYQLPAGSVGSIGDTVWLDADRGGTQNGSEPGIPGVTVSLIDDQNGDGNYDDGEPLIATTITNSQGGYLFDGIRADNATTFNYFVWVNDTDNVLMELNATFDSDGITPLIGLVKGLGISSVTGLTPAGDLTQDFGYAPPSHDQGEGLIGDTIFLDSNGSGSYDVGEGIESVLVELFESDGSTLLGTTWSNENGSYFFGNLATTGGGTTYVVEVVTGTLPNRGSLLSNTVDPDGGANSRSRVTLSSGSPINLDQDFGYAGLFPATIGDLVWHDLNADGEVEGGEAPLDGITVDLYEDVDASQDVTPADRLVGSTVTSGGGAYEFKNLVADQYLVDVTDDAGFLSGYWHSRGKDNANDNSQADPYAVAVTGSQTAAYVDFGYYVKPGTIGNVVWLDAGVGGGVANNGIFDEPRSQGINNQFVLLTINYPGGTRLVLSTRSAAEPPDAAVLNSVSAAGDPGWYSFYNVLLDEDYRGDPNGSGIGAGEPTYTVSAPLAVPFTTEQGAPDARGVGHGTDDNADLTRSEPAFPAQGTVDLTNDFGVYQIPTALNLLVFRVTDVLGTAVWLPALLGGLLLLLSLGTFVVYRRQRARG